MAYREPRASDFVGKTIESFHKDSVNCMSFIFTDGTRVEVWAEDEVFTPCGNVPGFFVEISSMDEESD